MSCSRMRTVLKLSASVRSTFACSRSYSTCVIGGHSFWCTRAKFCEPLQEPFAAGNRPLAPLERLCALDDLRLLTGDQGACADRWGACRALLEDAVITLPESERIALVRACIAQN